MSEIEKPAEREGNLTPAAQSLEDAKGASDIDGWGDEGRGYDYEYMVQELLKTGWVWTGEQGTPGEPIKVVEPTYEGAGAGVSRAFSHERALRMGAAIYLRDTTLTEAFLDADGTLHVHPARRDT